MKTRSEYDIINGPFVGGFGRVWYARSRFDPSDMVAIKEPKDPANAHHVKALEREVHLYSQIQSQWVLELVGYNLNANPPYVMTRFVPNGSAAEAPGPLSVSAVCLALLHVSGALIEIHKLGGFHRDIKPDNIFMNGEAHFQLGDMGLSRVDKGDSTLTRSICGTPGYIDPQIVNNGEFDQTADIYSLGITALALFHNEPGEVIHRRLEQGTALNELTSSNNALVLLIKAMIQPSKKSRPTAHIIHSYCKALFEHQPLPALTINDESVEAEADPMTFGEMLAIGGMLTLAVLGIRALLKGPK